MCPWGAMGPQNLPGADGPPSLPASDFPTAPRTAAGCRLLPFNYDSEKRDISVFVFFSFSKSLYPDTFHSGESYGKQGREMTKESLQATHAV